MINSNPVLPASHVQNQVEVFFKETVVDGPSGKIKYDAGHAEFKVRGSPHVQLEKSMMLLLIKLFMHF